MATEQTLKALNRELEHDQVPDGDVERRFAELADRQSLEEYNYLHFRPGSLWRDVQGTRGHRGLRPGDYAEDFRLPAVDGSRLRLDNLRGNPVLLRFASASCPFSVGAIEPLKKLHARWGERVFFVDILIRQAHPGTDCPAYRTDEQKMADARRYQREHEIPWPVLVDTVDGMVHQVYGGLSSPTYLLDVHGHVAYYDLWSHAPCLHSALEQLFAQDGKGVVGKGYDSLPHLLPALTAGWPALERGKPESLHDMRIAAPGAAELLKATHQLRPILGPLTLRAEPFSTAQRVALIGGAVTLGMLARRNRRA